MHVHRSYTTRHYAKAIDSMYNCSDEWYFNILHVPPIHPNRTHSAILRTPSRQRTNTRSPNTREPYNISKEREQRG